MLSPAQRLLFWRIAAGGGCVWVGAIHPVPPPALRRALENSGLVIQKQVLDPLTGRQATQLEITDRGWKWAEANMGGTFSNSPGAAETLSVLLEKLSAFLRIHDLQVTELFTAASAAPPGPAAREEPDSLVEAIDDRWDTPAEMIDAGLVRQIVTLTSGRPEVPIPLRNLRRLLDIHQRQWEESLRRLQRSGRIELLPATNLQAISVEDREAAFFDEQGNPVLHVQLTHQLAITHK